MDRTILWVDDEPNTVAGQAARLAHHGCQVVFEEDPAAAREALATQPFDMVVLDQRLSASDASQSGAALIAEVKSRAGGGTNSDVPFVFLTAYGGRDVIDGELESLGGYRGVFPKSGDFSEPLAQIIQTLGPGARGVSIPDADTNTAENLIEVPGLVGPNGEPLSSDDPPYERLTLAFRSISDEVLRWLAEHPNHLYEMDARDFENLVAGLFERDGFHVDLTPASGDGGVDLFAARHTGLGMLRYVVECKRYRADKPVGIALVQRLRGVLDGQDATAAVLATTSYFTEPAKAEQRKYQLRCVSMSISWSGLRASRSSDRGARARARTAYRLTHFESYAPS